MNFKEKRQEMFQCESIEQLQQFINENSDFFLHNPYCDIKISKNINPKINIKIHISRFDFKVSNSHSAPIGKETNWGGNAGKEVPRSYPGWTGRIVISRNFDAGFEIDHFNQTGINSGTGGAGTYELKLFAHDFKAMFFQHYLECLHSLEKNLGLSSFKKNFNDVSLLHAIMFKSKEFEHFKQQLKESQKDISNVIHAEVQKLSKSYLVNFFDVHRLITDFEQENGSSSKKIFSSSKNKLCQFFVSYVDQIDTSEMKFYEFIQFYEFYQKLCETFVHAKNQKQFDDLMLRFSDIFSKNKNSFYQEFMILSQKEKLITYNAIFLEHRLNQQSSPTTIKKKKIKL